jgi:arylsulfatase A-like enzyme
MFGIRVGRWKYLEALEEGRKELFDLERDPGELNNLVDEKQEQAAAFSTLLREMAGQFDTPSTSGSQWTAEDVERLEALGYVR